RTTRRKFRWKRSLRRRQSPVAEQGSFSLLRLHSVHQEQRVTAIGLSSYFLRANDASASPGVVLPSSIPAKSRRWRRKIPCRRGKSAIFHYPIRGNSRIAPARHQSPTGTRKDSVLSGRSS